MFDKLLNERQMDDGAKHFEFKNTRQQHTEERAIAGIFCGPMSDGNGIYWCGRELSDSVYTDVLGLGGAFLAAMPIISRLITGVIGIFLGRMIEKTRTRQGKARPYLLVSGFLMPLGVLLYAVPNGSYELKVVWTAVSYNLFYSLVYAIYSLSHSMMVPLSTRNTAQREGLAVLSSVATSMLPGVLTTIALPIMVSRIGVGPQAQGAWLSVMGALSALALPAALMEYYFTLERVTLEKEEVWLQESSVWDQAMVCLRSKEWMMCMLFVLALNLANAFSGGSMIYYCNWVLADSVSEGAAKQILVNVIGQMPLGIGAFLLWPLIKRFGKKRVTYVGFAVAAAGSCMVLLGREAMPIVLTGLLIRSVGSLPVYALSAHQADALDAVERESGFRADGLTASMIGFFQTVSPGIAQSMLLWGMNLFGYAAPEAAAYAMGQNRAMQLFFACCFALIPMIGYTVCSLSMRTGRQDVDCCSAK